MNYWITTDTHLGHEKLLEYGRPERFSEKILKGVRNTVRRKDVLIHLGDICIGNDMYWHEELLRRTLSVSTKKWLVKGNHDRKSDTWYLNNGWDFVSDRIYLEKFGAKILFSHIPVGIIGDYTFDINIHGHFHDSDHRRNEPEISAILSDRNILVALEYTNYMPVNLKKIVGKNWM